MPNIKLLVSALVIACWCLPASAETTRSAPTSRPAQPADRAEVQAARKAIAQAVAALAKDLSSDNSARREAAHRTLAALGEAVLTEVVAQSKLTDPEQLARAGELFTTLSVSARQGQMLLSLPAEKRKLVAAFAQAEPKLFNSVFSENAAAAAKAVARLAESSKPGADILIAWAARHEQWEVRMAAITAAGEMEKPDGAVNDAVLQRLTKTVPKEPTAEESAGVPAEPIAYAKDQLARREHRAAIYSLVGLKDRRVLPRLLEILRANNGEMESLDDGCAATPVGVVELILQLKDKRTVVTLMDYVKDTQEISTQNYDNKKITILKGDLAMTVILLQTGQKLQDYGFYIPPDVEETDNPLFGFEKGAKRREAQKKLRDWWETNKKDYEGVEKIPLGREEKADQNPRPDVPEFVPLFE
jgi:hypothetical protein